MKKKIINTVQNFFTDILFMVMKVAAKSRGLIRFFILLIFFSFILSEAIITKENPLLSIEVARKEYLKGHYDKAMDVLMETDVKTVDRNIKALIYLEMAYVKYLMGYRGFSCRFYLKKAMSYTPEPEGIGLYEKGFLKILKELQNRYTPEEKISEEEPVETPAPEPVKKKINVTSKPVTEKQTVTTDTNSTLDIKVFEKHYDERLKEIHTLKSRIATLNTRIRNLNNQKSKTRKDSESLKKEQQDLKTKSRLAEEKVTELTQQIEQMKRDQEVMIERIVAAKLKEMEDELKNKAATISKEDAEKREATLNSLEILHRIWQKENPPAQDKKQTAKEQPAK